MNRRLRPDRGALALGVPLTAAFVRRGRRSTSVSRRSLRRLARPAPRSPAARRAWIDGRLRQAALWRRGATAASRPTAQAADAALIWKPQFATGPSGLFDVEAQPEQRAAARTWSRPIWPTSRCPSGGLPLQRPRRVSTGQRYRSSTAAGLGVVTETITPSAINSWVGEELKVMGVEGQAVQGTLGRAGAGP